MPVHVFAVSDLHGYREQAHRALRAAHLIDRGGYWCAENTKLVVMGDSIDRGPDSKRVVDDLLMWRDQASLHGSELVHLLGNHEAMMLMGAKSRNAGDLWYRVGGQQCLDSYGMARGSRYTPGMTDHLVQIHGDYYLNLESYHVDTDLDTLFVHAGTSPNRVLADLLKSQDHLWIEPPDFTGMPPETLRERYGVGRVVFGHSPRDDRSIQSHQAGTFLGIDTGSFLPRGKVTVVELLPQRKYRVAGVS